MALLHIYPTRLVNQYIDHSSTILDVAKNLFMNSEYADVTFLIKGQRFPAHRMILAVRFEYFRVMLYGGFSEARKSEIELDVNPDAFKVILEYVYTGVLDMKLYTEEALVDVLNLANEYCFADLIAVLLPTLCKRFTKENYGVLMNVALLYSQDSFYNVYLDVLDRNADHILRQECFKLLNKEALSDIIRRDTFSGCEIEIFKSVMKWSETHTEEDLKHVTPHIRFNLMQIDELRTQVQPTGVLTEKEINDIIKEIKTLNRLPCRAGKIHRVQQKFLPLERNSMYGDALTISEGREIRGPSYFQLQRERMINHIFMDLADCVCSYHVEVSTDCREWKRIIDYSKYRCSSEQFLYFSIEAVRYICIVPHYMEKTYHRIDKIECDHKFGSVPIIFDEFVAPIYNMHHAMTGYPYNWKYDSNDALTSITKNITDSGILNFSLHQPLYINSIYLKNEHGKFSVSKIESAVEENNFTKLSFHLDNYKCYMFEAHVINFLRITFSRRPNQNKLMRLKYFFNPGKMTGPYDNWREFIAEVRRTGKFN